MGDIYNLYVYIFIHLYICIYLQSRLRLGSPSWFRKIYEKGRNYVFHELLWMIELTSQPRQTFREKQQQLLSSSATVTALGTFSQAATEKKRSGP